MNKFKQLSTLMLLLLPLNILAVGVGDTLTVDGIRYEVTVYNQTTGEKFAKIKNVLKGGAVTIPETVQFTIDNTFIVNEFGGTYNGGNKNVTSLTLPNTITKITGDQSFGGFDGLTELKLPTGIESIEDGCFAGMEKLEAFGWNDETGTNNNYFTIEDGILYNKSQTNLLKVPQAYPLSGEMEFTLKESVTTIHKKSLTGWGNVVTINLGANVTTIAEGGIGSDKSLINITVDDDNPNFSSQEGILCNKEGTSILIFPMGRTGYTVDNPLVIPAGITTIEPKTFSGATIKAIDLNEVTTIKESAFEGCNQLSNVSITQNTTYIGKGAFGGVSSLQTIKVNGDVNGETEYFKSINGVLYNKDVTHLMAFPCNNTTALDAENCFNIPETVEVIDSNACWSARNMERVIIPAATTTIEPFAFRACSILGTVTFTPVSNLTTIGNRVFWESGIEQIEIPASVKTIGYGAFATAKSLTKVTVADGSQLVTIDGQAFIDCTSLTEFTFNGTCTLKTIGEKAFSGTKIASFAFPQTVTDIGKSAFKDCKELASISFAENPAIRNIKAMAFADSGLENVTLPEGVKTVEKEAFRNCNQLESIFIPESTTLIDPEAFKYCPNLSDIEVAGNNSKYSSVQGFLCDKNKTKLILFPPGKAREDFTLLPPSLTSIGDFAFYDCGEKFTNISIPAKVTSIGGRAFGMDKNLKSIAFLCDEPIDPENIRQDNGWASFDDGQTAPNTMKDITIYVRKDLYDTYKNVEPYKSFYAQFKEIKTSFTAAHSGDLTANENCDEYFPMSNTAVNLLSTKADVKTYVVPETVKDADNNEYTVSLIGDYAFENANANIEEVVVKGDVGYIGAMAFLTKVKREGTSIKPNGTTIKQVIFTSNTPAEWLSKDYFGLTDDFKEFSPEQKIYVKKTKVADYQTAWSNFENQIGYKIPGIAIGKKYGTFSREFDVDLSDANSLGKHVYAFTSGEIREGTGDYGESEYHVIMHSVNVADNGDGTYIPAGEGVLLKYMDGETLPEDYYYCIGEKDDRIYTVSDNVMKGVTINNQSITDTNHDIWVMQGGIFRSLDGATVSMPIHKAYLQLAGIPAGAKLMFAFEEPNEIEETIPAEEVENTTDIEDNLKANATHKVYYDLQGRRVINPKKGIYIVNGKKVIM